MNVTCTHCVNEFEVKPDVDGSTPKEGPCPACGRTTPFRTDEEAAAGGLFARAAAEARAADAAAKPKEASLLITIGEVQRLGHTLRAASSASMPAQGGSMLADIRMIKSVIAQQEESKQAAKVEKAKQELFAPKGGGLAPVVAMAAAPVTVRPAAGRPGWILPVVIVVGLAVIASIAAVVIVMSGSKEKKGGGEESTASAGMPAAEMTPPTAADAGPAMGPEMAADMAAAMGPEMAADMAADAMKPAEAMAEPMTPPRPAGPVPQLGPAEIEQGVATVKAQLEGCTKAQPGDYRFSLTVDGKTGKVTIAYLPRNRRDTATGRCLADAMRKAQFPTFTKKKQVVTHTVTVK